ncbi:integrative and conjugative element protein (TIGR02256 family) [Paenibacillus mucilaginosus]|uniref:Mov34/MPN/PAD-1 family protein n=1 Tax=Paenibacillus mucilaginosus TaxID=61624 RepID=UPI003D229B47
MHKSLFNLSDKRKLKLTSSAINTMFSYAQDDLLGPESGGIMVGRIIDENTNIIDDVSTPMSNDVRTRYRFYRKPNGHQEFFDERWNESEGRCFYLGEWHTHPEATPSPSAVDIRNWKKLLKNPSQDQNFLFFIIVGTEQLKIWLGENQNGLMTIEYVGGMTRYD